MSEEGLQVSVSLPLYSPSISIDVCAIKLSLKTNLKKNLFLLLSVSSRFSKLGHF